eukprot:12830463-Ditylum_brightwellii.AAC.1
MRVNCQATAWQLTSISNCRCVQDLGEFAVCYWVKIDPATHSKRCCFFTKMAKTTVAGTTTKASFLLKSPPPPK